MYFTGYCNRWKITGCFDTMTFDLYAVGGKESDRNRALLAEPLFWVTGQGLRLKLNH
jgi:hypothetical protein